MTDEQRSQAGCPAAKSPKAVFKQALSHDGSPEAELELRRALVHVLGRTEDMRRRWVFSFVGNLVERKTLTVLNMLAQHEFEVTLRLSELLKESEEQAIGFCEIAFTASHSVVAELLLTTRTAG